MGNLLNAFKHVNWNNCAFPLLSCKLALKEKEKWAKHAKMKLRVD